MPANRSCSLTTRDAEILRTLTLRVRFLSVNQVAQTWWDSRQNAGRLATRRLTRLESSGLIERFRVVAHPLIRLENPLAKWARGMEPPHFGKISYRLRKRWNQPAIVTPVVMPTHEAVRRFGGRVAHRPRTVETTHDMHLAAVYLIYLHNHPETAATWLPEDVIAPQHTSALVEQPDALIRVQGRLKVVEFGGAYRPERLAELHDYCNVQKIAYEIW